MRGEAAVFAVILVSGAMSQAPRPEAPNPEATSGAIQRRVAPPVRITNFTVQPASLQAGQQAVLIWATENPAGVTIEPAIGRVASRGTLAVSPSATTNVFAQPWRITRRFTLRSDLNKVDEFVCEHNEDYSKYFKKE